MTELFNSDELTAFVLNTITTINKPTLYGRLCELAKILGDNCVMSYIAVSSKKCCLLYAENGHIAVLDEKFHRYIYEPVDEIAKKHLNSKKIKLYMGVYENGNSTKTRND